MDQTPAPIPASTQTNEPTRNQKIIQWLMQIMLYCVFFFLGYIAARLETLFANI